MFWSCRRVEHLNQSAHDERETDRERERFHASSSSSIIIIIIAYTAPFRSCVHSRIRGVVSAGWLAGWLWVFVREARASSVFCVCIFAAIVRRSNVDCGTICNM